MHHSNPGLCPHLPSPPPPTPCDCVQIPLFLSGPVLSGSGPARCRRTSSPPAHFCRDPFFSTRSCCGHEFGGTLFKPVQGGCILVGEAELEEGSQGDTRRSGRIVEASTGAGDEGMRDCRGSRDGLGGLPWREEERSAEEEERGGVPGVRVWRFSVGCSGGCPVATCHWKRMDACVASASGGRWAEVRFLALSRLTPDLSPDVGGPADPIAPTIIIPPKNTSVVAGTSEVTMECVANARWAVPLPTPRHSPSLPTQGLLRGDLSEFREALGCPTRTQQRRQGI